MEFVNRPITDFYRHSLSAASDKGFIWVVTLLAREADVDGLYYNLRNTWTSLDSITGKYFLFIFAGKENITHDDRWHSKILDSRIGYFGEYNDYIKFINPDAQLCGTHIQYEFYKSKSLDSLEESQTLAVNELRDFFSINEADIPCLVFTKFPLLGYVRTASYVVPISGNNIYGFFKRLFNAIDPLLKQIDILTADIKKLSKRTEELEEIIKKTSLDPDGKILAIQRELLIYAENNIVDDTGRSLRECINSLSYGKSSMPFRSMLSKYVDLVKNYEKKTGKCFDSSIINERSSQNATTMAQAKAELFMVQHKQVKLSKLCNDLMSEIENIIRGSRMDEKTYRDNKQSISVTGGTVQINTAFDTATVIATQYVGYDENRLSELVENVRNALLNGFSADEAEVANANLDIIEEELKQSKPRKGFLKAALTGLKTIKGTTEFGAAVATLVQFVQTLF